MSMKRYQSLLRIGTKTLLSHLTLCIVVIVLAAVLSYTLTVQYMKEQRMEQLLKSAEYIAENYWDNAKDRFRPSRRAMHMSEDLTGSRIFFLDTEGESIRMSSYRPEPRGNDDMREPLSEQTEEVDDLQWIDVQDSIDREFTGRVLSGEHVSTVRRFEFAQDEIVFAGAPIVDAEQTIRGGIILAQPISRLRSLSRMVRYLLTLVMSVSLLLAVILAMQLSRMLVRPIQRITSAARRMESGVYAERITQLPGDEIGELGHALNSMSGRLVDVIRNLRKERDKLELVISGIGEGLVAVDTRWRIVHANAAFLELAELDSASQLTDKEQTSVHLAPLESMLGRCMQTGEPQQMTWENPSHRLIQASATPFEDESNAILGTVCLLRDVSEAQRLEQLRRDYVANISHELRTPLTGIRGMVEPLIDGCMETEEERLESYRIILKETIRLEKLVGEMLDMSRLQDGRLRVELEPMELPGILEAAVRSMKSIADEGGVALSVETDGSPLACMGNEDRIMQVLVILIDNALSFTPRGGSVVVFARDGEKFVHVGVRDTGCGIEPKDLPFIWERFYKADRSRMRTTGTGLGLAIARLVTQLMGGDITVKSEPGEGAEFTFTLQKES